MTNDKHAIFFFFFFKSTGCLPEILPIKLFISIELKMKEKGLCYLFISMSGKESEAGDPDETSLLLLTDTENR